MVEKTYHIVVTAKSTATVLHDEANAPYERIAELRTAYVNENNADDIRIEFTVDNPLESIDLDAE